MEELDLNDETTQVQALLTAFLANLPEQLYSTVFDLIMWAYTEYEIDPQDVLDSVGRVMEQVAQGQRQSTP